MRGRNYRQYALISGTFLTLAFGSLLFFQKMDETRRTGPELPDRGMEKVTILFVLTGGAIAMSAFLPIRRE